MIRTPVIWLLTAFVCLVAAGPAHATAGGTLAERVEEFYRREAQGHALPFAEKAVSVTRGYEALSVGWRTDLANIDDADLASMFRATYLAAFYTFDPRHVGQLRAIFDELARRGLDSPFRRGQMHESLVGARMLDDARRFSKEFPAEAIDTLPKFASKRGAKKPGPSKWVVSPDERKLVLTAAKPHDGAQIVVVSHPNCHFSQAAVREIYADPVLGKAIAAHGTWLAPQAGNLDFDLMQQWNREHPQAPVALVFRQSDWPMLDYWGTPTFYILKDGKVEGKVVGWSNQGKKQALEDGLRKVGLLP